MSKPKFLYEIEKGQFVAHADGSRVLTLQHRHPLGSDGARDDMQVYISRENSSKVIEAIQQWLEQLDEPS